MHILPISVSNFDLAVLVDAGSKSLGQNLLAAVDNSRRSVSDHAKVVCALAALHSPNAGPTSVLSEATSVMRHLHYAYVVAGDDDDINEIRDRTSLAITSVRAKRATFAVVSGTLDQWKAAIIECCSPDARSEVRLLFSAFLVWFDRIGLSEVFNNYTRKSHSDKTLLLEHK